GAIFSYFNAVYYARLPYHNADRMVALAQESRAGASEGFSSVSLDALTLLRTARSFDRVSAYSEEVSVQMVGTEPEQIRALRVDTAFVPMFDLRPEIGRLLTAEEIVGNASVAMISDVFWRNRFGADPRAVGKSIVIADRPRSIVGVLPVGFRFPYQTDVIV